MLQLIEVLAFQIAAAPELINQPLGDGGEQGARFANRRQSRRFEQLHKGFGGDVFDAGAGPQIAAQPAHSQG